MNVDAGSQTKPYVVLARRYRPQRFTDVIGQTHITQTLQNAIRLGRVHHAYLFAGSRGVGKTTVARILARALNHSDGPTPDPPTTKDPEQEAKRAVDIIEIDGASHTGVDDVRELREGARYLPVNARYKIYIIDEVHMLSTNAFNALLKVLEEPPPHVVFVFATTEPQKIPATIRSRCQRFDFKRVPVAMLIKHLKSVLDFEAVKVEDAGLALIARAAEGGVRDALSLLDQVIASGNNRVLAEGESEAPELTAPIGADRVAQILGVSDQSALFALSRAICTRDTRAAFTLIGKLFRDGSDLVQVAQAFLAHLRDRVIIATCAEPAEVFEGTADEVNAIRASLEGQDTRLVQQQFFSFSAACADISRSQTPRFSLELAVAELCQLECVEPIAELIARLEALESRIVGGDATPSMPPAGAATPATPADKPPAEAAPDNGDRRLSQESPADDESPMDQWRRLLGKVGGPLAGVFATGNLVRWQDGEVVLGYAPKSFEFTRASDRERQEVFAQQCAQLLGRSFRVTVRELDAQEAALGLESASGSSCSAIATQEAERREQEADRREQAQGHVATRAVIEIFGATVESIDITTPGSV